MSALGTIRCRSRRGATASVGVHKLCLKIDFRPTGSVRWQTFVQVTMLRSTKLILKNTGRVGKLKKDLHIRRSRASIIARCYTRFSYLRSSTVLSLRPQGRVTSPTIYGIGARAPRICACTRNC
jgi:hypothetical protein